MSIERRTMMIRQLVLAVLATPTLVFAQGGRGGTASDSGKTYPLDKVVAVVGKKVITLFELTERINDENQLRLSRQQPGFSGDTVAIMATVLDMMIQETLLENKAAEMKLQVVEAEINATADQRIAAARAQYKTETEFRQE